MKKLFTIILVCLLSLTGFSQQRGGIKVIDSEKNPLTPARDLNGRWEGTLVCSDNSVRESNRRTDKMALDITQNGNKVTGTMTYGNSRGSFEGTVSGVHIYFTVDFGRGGCLKAHGTFTSTNMEGMRNSDPPPYITCPDKLNDGHGSKGIEWHLTKK